MKTKIIRLILHQYNTGVWYGAVNSLITNAMSFLAPLGYVAGLGTFYGVWRKEITELLPWLSIFWVAMFAVIGAALILLIEWKFIIPAKVRYANWQVAKHGNKIIEAINITEKRMNLKFASKEDIERIDKKLDQLLRGKA